MIDNKFLLTEAEFMTIRFLVSSIVAVSLYPEESKQQALFILVQQQHHLWAEKSGFSLDDFFKFCDNPDNYHGFVFDVDLADMEEHFKIVKEHEGRLKASINLYNHSNN
ncbi:hypothetical protein [Chitinophaga eiseniae]|uniref:Uncharacterized protein n=1 Tax=Chitinophaga eiseniae TaxID=634771 RepID=A0A847SLL7_9BACT|nr:hypothetical protein [Chitinophaga eiseniae]NLR78039.1 hypothetical protein [Chitinophaga eiseniae]